jgi:hypothetical protein
MSFPHDDADLDESDVGQDMSEFADDVPGELPDDGESDCDDDEFFDDEDIARDHLLAQQELEDFEDADDRYGSYGDSYY